MSKSANLPHQLDHMLRQAVALQRNGAFTEAEELYREILELKPRHFDALQLLGALTLQAGRLQEGVYERRVIIPKCGRFRHRPGRKAMR